MKLTFIIISLLLTNSVLSQKNVGINQKNPKFTLDVNGNISADSNVYVGHKLNIKEGENASIGEITLVGGLAQVFTNKISTTSKVLVWYKKPSFTSVDISVLYCPQELIIDKNSFIIKSELIYPEPFNLVNEGNNSTVYWWIIN